MRFIWSAVASLALIASVQTAQAADITWGGTYRIEAVKVSNPELSDAKSNKSYLLHHLMLAPKIVAADGLTIYSRLDLFNNGSFGITPSGQVYSVAGDTFGQSPSATTPTSTGNSNPFSRNAGVGMLGITSLYVSWAQEFGQFVVGRTPVQFGLGTLFNAGNGLFDHYIDTKDIVGYKLIFGNLSVFPMIGKVYEGNVGDEDDVNDYLVTAQWDNPESDLSIGALYQMRVWTYGANNAPLNGATGTLGGPTGASVGDGGKSTTWGVFAKRSTGDFKIGLEADMVSGDTGVKNAGGSSVSLNGLGIAGEVAWKPADKKISGGLKAGFATGDDPGTTDSYEGFAFSKNYDVALLMFNHPLGQADFLTTTGAAGYAAPVRNQIDTEAISNAIYIAPHFDYAANDKLAFGANVVYGILNKNPIAGSSTAKDLGFELDLSATWKPYERLTWIAEGGALFPGSAWTGGGQFQNSFAYGLVTKAAISF